MPPPSLLSNYVYALECEKTILPLEFIELTIWANRELGIDLYPAAKKWIEPQEVQVLYAPPFCH